MASQSQNSNTPVEELDEQVEVVEVQESETFADNSVDLDEAMSPEAKAAKKHIEDLAKKNNKSFGDMRMHIDDFPGKHDRKTQAAAKTLNKHQYGSYGEEVEQVEEKTLTPAEKKKREEVAKAIERDNPKMPMDKKMAIATATAKKVAESSISDRTKRLIERAINRKS